MSSKIETSTQPGTPTPISPYGHVAEVGQVITIGGPAGVDPATGQFAGAKVGAQARQISRRWARAGLRAR